MLLYKLCGRDEADPRKRKQVEPCQTTRLDSRTVMFHGILRLSSLLKLAQYRRILGDSLSSASGDVWRRHRRVVAPAFTNKMWATRYPFCYRLLTLTFRFSSVWKEARAVYDQMLQAEGWSHQTDIMFVEAHSFLLKVRLLSTCPLS